ncbi:protein of unknown function (plasmid) [Caballeronia sp. S22]
MAAMQLSRRVRAMSATLADDVSMVFYAVCGRRTGRGAQRYSGTGYACARISRAQR